jgi:hypothetical protein
VDLHPTKESLGVIEFCKQNGIQTISVSQNFGVWGRFSLPLLSKSQFIFILDDDVIPGEDWFANAVEAMNSTKCVVGGVGVLFKPHTDDYSVSKRIGWVNPEDCEI